MLVNNAGVVDDVPFLDLTEDEYDRVLRTNLKGAFLAGQAVRRGFTLVTANVREFERVDGLMWEDWSKSLTTGKGK